MQVTDRDVQILDLLLLYGFLVTAQIRSVVFPSDKDGSVTRDRLRKLEAAGFVMRRRAEVANPLTSNTIPVWIITEQGICQLSLRTNNARYLNQKPPCTRSWQNFAHYVGVSDVMMRIRQGMATQARVTVGDMFLEHTIVNDQADNPAQRYKLYQVVCELPRRIICAPDAAFELQVQSQTQTFRRAYYLELERGTDTPARIAAKKTPGYHGLNERQLWKQHYPHAADFRVLCVGPTSSWRDTLRKAVRGHKGSELWIFAALDELKPATLLQDEMIYTCIDGPRPLVRPEAAPQRG